MARADGLRDRTKRFAFGVVRLVKALPRTPATDAVARQLGRAGTSVAANHRAAGRARSRKEFAARLALVLEEADESEFWLETLRDCDLANPDVVTPLLNEASELRAIFAASLVTVRRNMTRS